MGFGYSFQNEILIDIIDKWSIYWKTLYDTDYDNKILNYTVSHTETTVQGWIYHNTGVFNIKWHIVDIYNLFIYLVFHVLRSSIGDPSVL